MESSSELYVWLGRQWPRINKTVTVDLLTSEKVSRATRDLHKRMGVKDGSEEAGYYIEEFFSSFPSANTLATLMMES